MRRDPLCFIGSALLFFSTEAFAADTPKQAHVSNNVEHAINNTIQSLIAAVSSRDIQQVMSLYTETVDYHEKGRVSRDVVRGDFEEYFSRWPITRWGLADSITVRPTGPDRAQVSFKIDFDVANEAEKRRIVGRAAETCFVEIDTITKKARIVAQHEKIIERRLIDSTAAQFAQPTKIPASSLSVATTSTPISGTSRPRALAAEAQRNLDAAAKSGHIGKAIQQLADQQQLTKEIKNEWPLPPDLMREWKHALIGDADNSQWTHATFLNDHAIEQLRQMFNIPKDEEIYGCFPRIDEGQAITDVSGFDKVQ